MLHLISLKIRPRTDEMNEFDSDFPQNIMTETDSKELGFYESLFFMHYLTKTNFSLKKLSEKQISGNQRF